MVRSFFSCLKDIFGPGIFGISGEPQKGSKSAHSNATDLDEMGAIKRIYFGAQMHEMMT